MTVMLKAKGVEDSSVVSSATIGGWSHQQKLVDWPIADTNPRKRKVVSFICIIVT